MKPLDLFQYYWENYIVNEYFRSDVKELSSIDDVKEIHNKDNKTNFFILSSYGDHERFAGDCDMN